MPPPYAANGSLIPAAIGGYVGAYVCEGCGQVIRRCLMKRASRNRSGFARVLCEFLNEERKADTQPSVRAGLWATDQVPADGSAQRSSAARSGRTGTPETIPVVSLQRHKIFFISGRERATTKVSMWNPLSAAPTRSYSAKCFRPGNRK